MAFHLMKRHRFLPCITVLVWIATSPAFASESSNVTELHTGWRMAAANDVTAKGVAVSQPSFDASKWYGIREMPATVLQTLEDNGVYKDLYYGTNLGKVPELWKQDWWYRTTFSAPAGREVYSLIFKGINYRADVWLNGHKIGDRTQVVGMYNRYEFNVTRYIKPGGSNVLAVKVTPERLLQGIDGVELGDTWLDWINWNYIGYRNP